MPGGLDHFVVAARDLDALAGVWQRMGFQVGARNQHDWGTENHIIQFDGMFVELIGLKRGFAPPEPDDPAAPFAGFIDRYLDARDGFAMVVLESQDADADATRWAEAGLGAPRRLDFRRTGRNAQDEAVTVAFSLAFATHEALPDAGLFVCQQHHPENFWFPARQVHANGAIGVADVVMVSRETETAVDVLKRFAGREPVPGAVPDVITFNTGRGSLSVVTPDVAMHRYGAWTRERDGQFVAIHVRVGDLAATRAHLDSGGITHQWQSNAALTVGPEVAHGVAIVFQE